MEMIEINNSVKLNELYNGKQWIHGDTNENISITIFIITIEGKQLKYCLDAINNLNKSIPVVVNVIMKISPTSLAYNTMLTRCITKYFIQLDEDMELFSNSIQTIQKNLLKMKNNCYLHYYYLIDDYLGINNPPVIIGIKIYKFNIMKGYDISKYNTEIISSVDQLWHKNLHTDGFHSKQFFYPIGYHARKRSCFDIMLRYCKMVKSLLDPRIEAHRSDKMKLVKPMNKIGNFNKFYRSLVIHFCKLGYDINIFLKNNLVLANAIAYISEKNFGSYGIQANYVKVDLSNNYEFNQDIFSDLYKIPLGNDMVNIKNIYAIVGIINSLFENYQYSYEHYPYDIDKYFKKVLSFNLLIITDVTNPELLVDYNIIDDEFVNVDLCTKENFSNFSTTKYDLIVDTFDNQLINKTNDFVKITITDLVCNTERLKII